MIFNNYINIRDSHILQKVSFGINKDKISYWSLKDVISEQMRSVRKISKNAFEIELDEDVFYKAMHCETELFMNKMMIQYADYKSIESTSRTWSFVTMYYFGFFNLTCLFRICNRGFVFFSNEHLKKITQFYELKYNEVYALGTGNYYFNIKEVTDHGSVIITLNQKPDVHKSSWEQFVIFLSTELRKTCNNQEGLIYDELLKDFSAYTSMFPSQMRNKLNYNGDSSVLDLKNKLPQLELYHTKDEFINYLNGKKDKDENIDKLKKSSYIISYLFNLNIRLYKEYLSRNDFCLPFNKERIQYFKNRNIEYPKLLKNK